MKPWWPILVVVLVVLLAGAGALALWLKRRVRRRRAKLPSRLKHPVVLAHGLLGFDAVKLGSFKQLEYFRGVPEQLRRMGAEVHVVRVPPSAGVAARAEELARAVRLLDAEKVNIIAHSMGGLDARYAISRLGLQDKVASLTTIGAPHRGTPLADLGTHLLGEKLGLRWLLGGLGVELGAFYDLTTAKMEAFNQQVPDAPRHRVWLVRGVGGAEAVDHQSAVAALVFLLGRARGRERWPGAGELAALGRGAGHARSRPLGADRLVEEVRRARLLHAAVERAPGPRALTAGGPCAWMC